MADARVVAQHGDIQPGVSALRLWAHEDRGLRERLAAPFSVPVVEANSVEMLHTDLVNQCRVIIRRRGTYCRRSQYPKRVNSSRADGDDAMLIESISAGMSFDTFNPA